jgi:peptide/nickel transport system permease protein
MALIIRRLALAIPVLVGLLMVTFLLSRVVPTDPAIVIAGEGASTEQIQLVREKLGLDRPLYEQFARYVVQVARFDFGDSIFSKQPVKAEILRRLPATLELTFVSLAFGTLIGIPMGVVAAVNHNRWLDIIIRLGSVAGVAIASFWLAIMLQLLFAMDLGWLPLHGRMSDAIPPLAPVTGLILVDSLLSLRFDAFVDGLRHLALPAITLSLSVTATIARFTRAGVLDTLQKDFVLYERAAGFPPGRLIWIYVLRNSVVAAITQIGLLFGGLIAGAVVVEAIFDWPS